MTSAVVVYQTPEDVRRDIGSLREQMEEILPSRIDPDRFLRVVAKAIIEDSRLMKCSRLSLLSAMHEAAQLGLEPTGLLGSAYLVPYGTTARLIPGYRGLIDLARRSGEIDAIEARTVRLRDELDYVPTRQPDPVRHRPYIPNPTDDLEDRDPGPYVGAYMVAMLKGGHVQAEWMTYDEIEAVRRRSRAATDGPWVTDWSEMARKTVVRRGSKYLPLTTDFRRALELDEEAEREASRVPISSPPSRAAQMLLDRAAASAGGLGDPEPIDTPDDPSPEESAAPGPSEAVVEPLPVHDPYGPAPVAPPGTTPTPPPDATAICGHVNAELGICTRAPDHQAGHANEEGRWPRGK
jgi:recombination protein RecT